MFKSKNEVGRTSISTKSKRIERNEFIGEPNLLSSMIFRKKEMKINFD
jgi:hypothetical protein